jgi:hypothetical protein
MSYRPGDPYHGEFTTCSATTGGAQNADTLPVATATRNGVDDVTFELAVVNLDTGRYKLSGTVPPSYAQGDSVHVSVAATVGGVTGKAIIDAFVLDSKRVGDLNDASPAPTVAQIRQELDANSTRLANLDATISSRSTYAGADTAGTATLLSRLTAQRATNLDNLDAAVSTRSSHTAAAVWAVASRTLTAFSHQVVVGGYASGQDPSARIDAASADLDAIRSRTDLIPPTGFPANFANLAITTEGLVRIDGAQVVPTTGNAPNSINDCLNAARAQGFGKWVLNGTSLSLFAADGTTTVRTFVLDSPISPTSRS